MDTQKKTLKQMYKDAGINPSRTLEEEYIHAIHECSNDGTDISEVYDHDEYLKAKHSMSITGKVQEPTLANFLGAMVFASAIALIIEQYLL